jgi:hypothetical protein
VNQDIRLSLNAQEALVLFEFLTRFSDDHQLTIIDQAEARVLWDLQCRLEPLIDSINNPRYEEELAEARASVRDPDE